MNNCQVLEFQVKSYSININREEHYQGKVSVLFDLILEKLINLLIDKN
ncbi:hypothetical protein CMALT430_80013 [Carnobacterium maltaromaticum]|nr:hypothetical protein CMALT430_80013 [Carnobacterium maltaromaticum]